MLVIGLIISFALILFLVKKKVPIGISVISGGILLALTAGLNPIKILRIIIFTFTEKNTLELIATVIMISVLSNVMKEYGVMEMMVTYLEKMFKSTKALLFIIPSLLSTFTMTGSAIVAAPIVDSLGDKIGLVNPKKAAINLYVRHAWYFVLPISVPLINASYLSNIPIRELMKAQLPVAIACLIAAYLVYIKPLNNSDVSGDNESRGSIIYNTILFTSPLLVCVFLVFWIPFYIALVLGCILAYLIRKRENRLSQVLLKSKNIPLILAAAGIMIFKNIIGNIPQLKSLILEVTSLGIPLELLTIIITIFISYAVANPTLLVGMMYPLILPLVPAEQQLAMAVLIFTVGFSAYFISPVHLCQALTNEYFCVSTGDLYKEYKITVPVMFISGILTYLLLRYFI
ncbi:MAG: uncharacterized protein PWQ67_39 [Clostridia bacterium]|jgi:hypothetical protein|nr:uncharacterized protein [Clostridia bacterium]MDN5321585.1 uncharacterized protein [Clostridia bacterium]